MEEVKSKGKLKGFTDVIISAAQGRADAARAEADEQEKQPLKITVSAPGKRESGVRPKLWPRPRPARRSGL